MNRREFLVTAATASALPFAAFAGNAIDYKDGVIEKALSEGKTVFVDYATDWCTTCARQERVIQQLRAENPAYNANITFVRVDWDKYSSRPVATDRRIPRRSTLIVLKGDQELGRIVAGTSKNQIKALMDTALTAATS